MNDKVKGLILTISDYSEADVMMQVLTKEYGILSFVGKSSKKINSKNHFLPLCLYEFIIDYKEGKTIYTVHGQKLIRSYFESQDLEYVSFKNILVELALKNKDIDTYDQLKFVFDHMTLDNKYLLGSMFLSYLIKCFGIMPVVDGCVVCNNQKVVSLSNTHGGFLCMNHLNGNEILSVEHLKKFRLIIKANFEHYDVIKENEYDYKDFCILMDFFLENSDLHLRSFDFYQTIN